MVVSCLLVGAPGSGGSGIDMLNVQVLGDTIVWVSSMGVRSTGSHPTTTQADGLLNILEIILVLVVVGPINSKDRTYSVCGIISDYVDGSCYRACF